MFIGLIDTRKKIALIREGFKEKANLTHDELLKEVYDMASLRNVIAHSSFHDSEGEISLDYVSYQGVYGWKKKKRDDELSNT